MGYADSRPRTNSRPTWVYLVFGVYLILVATVTYGPVVFIAVDGGTVTELGVTLIYAGVLLACGMSLLVIPLDGSGPRRQRRRLIWFPLIGSATLAMAVFFGLALASHEFASGYGYGNGKPNAEMAMQAICIALPCVWLAWVVIFWMVSSRFDREKFNGILYKTLVAGSVLELLIALPMHIIVRRRGECCAGIYTGIGIGIGLIVLVIAIGPAIFFLFYRRYQQTYARPRGGQCGEIVPRPAFHATGART